MGRRYARDAPAGAPPRRWAHVQGVAARACSLAPVLGADAELLQAAAWLHDIGYAPDLAVTGLHALDGARYLRDVHHATPCCPTGRPSLLRHLRSRRNADSPTSSAWSSSLPARTFQRFDLLDMTTNPDGELVPVDRRLAEIHDHSGPHLVSRSIQRAAPMIVRPVERVQDKSRPKRIAPSDIGTGAMPARS